jgi:TonB family protein
MSWMSAGQTAGTQFSGLFFQISLRETPDGTLRERIGHYTRSHQVPIGQAAGHKTGGSFSKPSSPKPSPYNPIHHNQNNNHPKMNTRTKSVLVSLSLLAALPAFAHEENAPTPRESESSVPVPTRIVHPGVSPGQIGKVVRVQLTITKEGKPTDIRTVDFPQNDPLFAERVIRALRSWEFAPARDSDGRPVAMKVTMPIRVDGFVQPGRQLDPRQDPSRLVAAK